MRWIALAALCVACAGEVTGEVPDGEPTADTAPGHDAAPPPLVTLTFTESSADILNPERGLDCWVSLDGSAMGWAREAGYTIAHSTVRLDAFRTSPIDAATLDALARGFAEARAAGLKIKLRFAYNAGMDADAPEDWILTHVGQLAPVLQANADVIAFMDAGFIGAWGEWHSSTNGLDNPDSRRVVLGAVLDALPVERAVIIRTPMYKAQTVGGPIADAQAWDGSDVARVGHLNDCFLASDTDYGTYADPIEDWKAFVAEDTLYVPMSGETCVLDPPRSDCESALAELARMHWSVIGDGGVVVDAWQAEGCKGEIRARLGYRLVLTGGQVSAAVRPGDVAVVAITLENRGFASPYNRRPLYVVLDDGRRLAAELPVEVRRFWPGEPISITAAVRLPTDVPPGEHVLALWLPDASPSLRDRPEYAIQLADEGVWDAANGWNALARLTVDPAAAPTDDPAALPLVELPR